MKKRMLAMLLSVGLATMLGLAACSQPAPESPDAGSGSVPETPVEQQADGSAEAPESDGAEFGFAVEDPIENAVYQYLMDEVSKDYDAADASIPVVRIVRIDDSNPDEVLVYGDYWIDNYSIEGDTLVCVSGGNYPGVMHLVKDGDVYTVSSFDVVADGAGFDESAHELFGDDYDAFMEIYGNSDAREEIRTQTISEYVDANGIEVTQYQDYGWDPVPLD